jgi:hypothetical protein
VVTEGVTVALSEEVNLPTPLSILTDVAFDTSQVSVLELPADILGGLETKKFIIGGFSEGFTGSDTMTSAVAVTLLPEELVAVSV